MHSQHANAARVALRESVRFANDRFFSHIAGQKQNLSCN